MTADTEKALLEWAKAQVLYNTGVDNREHEQWRDLLSRGRAYLATLEPKPARCACVGWTCGHPSAQYDSACVNDAMPKSDRCAHCTPRPKPEPKRGVEELIAHVAAELEGAELRRTHPVMEELRDALRLYREERKRVQKVAREMWDAIRAPVGKSWDAALKDWADELEGK